MAGFTSNFINLIADNLRDRYHSGFPILKELIQNADDSKASRFIFGIHKGFEGRSDHTLLQGAGIWCLNNGKFKVTDKRAIRSFAENAKAGENGTIGKFGLGMKSVFHLCEAFFYVAFNGKETYSEFLNPWDDRDSEVKHLHADWDTVDNGDWALLQRAFTDHLDAAEQWFLLWIPLRQKRHIQSPNGEEYGSIIANFPGDDLGKSLDFLRDDDLAIKLGELLPLLSNLREIQFVPLSDDTMWKTTGFSIRLDSDAQMVLPEDSAQNAVSTQGYIAITANQTDKKLPFKGNKQQSVDQLFQALKQQENWPKTRYRNEQGKEAIAPDKSRAEGAVLISHQEGTQGKLTLQWAVFLPLEEKTHIISIDIEGGFRHYHIVLHGQFFIDAGRRGIHEFQRLHSKVTELDGQLDEQMLRTTWNQALAQNVTLSLILQTLHDYVDFQGLTDKEINGLTKALHQGLKQLLLLAYVCREHVWFRELSQTGGRWQLHKKTDSQRILPLPAPPQDAPNRPWEVLPCLQTLSDTLFKDNDSADINNASFQWTADIIQQVLQEPTSNLFAEAGQLDYFNKFLHIINSSLPLDNEKAQKIVLRFIREAIKYHEKQRLEKNKDTIISILGYVSDQNRWKFSTNVDNDVLKVLWQCETAIFPTPTFLDSKTKPSQGKPNGEIAKQWLESLQKIQSESSLKLKKEILKSLNDDERLNLVKSNPTWKITSAYDAHQDKEAIISYQELLNAKEKFSLFGSTSGKNPHEKIKILAKSLKNQSILVINSDEQNLFLSKSKEHEIPKEDSNEAILTALIRSDADLTASIESRANLLKKCHDIDNNNSDAKNGLRYLLHASSSHKESNEKLWVNDRKQKPVWEKLWTEIQKHKKSEWSVINRNLANTIYNRWDFLNIEEVEESSILNALQDNYTKINRENFTPEEQVEILCSIKCESLWRKLAWHKTTDGRWVSIDANTYLKTAIELPNSLKHEVNIIEFVSDLQKQQHDWIKKLDEAAAISIALKSHEPSEYNKEILTWLEKNEVKPDLEEGLKSENWLLLKNNRPISPNDIIAIVGLEDAIQKLAATANYIYASDKDLHESILNHSAYDDKVKSLFSNEPKDLLEVLGLLMSEVSDYAIGSTEENDDIEKLANTLTDCDAAPSWSIIKAAIGKFGLDDCRTHLIKNLNSKLKKENFLSTLAWLSGNPTKQSKQAYNYYLHQMVAAGFANDLLPKIKLLAADKKNWKLAGELCIDAPGISNDCVLDSEQHLILREYIKTSDLNEKNESLSHKEPINNLNVFLSPLAHFLKKPQLGLLLLLLGEKSTATNYLGNHSIITIKKLLGWTIPDMGDYWINKYTENWSIEHAFEKGFIFMLFENKSSNGHIILSNILGREITALLSETPKNLIIKKEYRDRALPVKNNGLETITIPLHFLNKSALSKINTSNADWIAKETCSFLWKNIFGQNPLRIEYLWKKLSDTNQLDIAVTYKMILDGAAFYLENMGATKENPLKDIIRKYKDSKRRIIESDQNSDKSNKDKWQVELQKSEGELTRVLSIPDIERHILGRVKDRLTVFQYERNGILFELFQNADDAALELARCETYPTIEARIEYSRFHIEIKSNTLYILHWGRPINYRGNADTQANWPGFEEDLEKMLILSASGKSDDKAVTGRFGLGFKSVFLACDSPKIISGDLKVNIVAGFLPKVWQGVGCIEAAEILREKTSNPRYQGTLVALPLRDDVEPESILSRFQAQQVMLCMTAKMLRSITVNDHNFTWQPNYLPHSKRLEFGKLNGKHYLVFRDQLDEGYAALIFHVSARGFELLTDDIPSFWVVAPTREKASVGFVISASFQIDAGRGKLAGLGEHDDKNKALIQQLGKRLGFALADLYKTDWESLHKKLQLAQDVTQVEWWTSLWKQFSDNDEWNKNDAPFHLAKAFVKSLLISWAENAGLIPNGLPQEQADLVQADSISHSIPKNWHSANALQHLRGWEAFDKAYPSNQIIEDWVLQIWRKLKPDSRIAELGLNNLIELIEDKKCGVDIADKLGGFFAIIYKNEKPTDNEKNQLSEIHFLSKQGTYKSSDALLSEYKSEKEEKLRVSFAPNEHVLPDTYQENGKQFFRICRKQMGCADKLESWFTCATDKQQAALCYIVEGEKGNDIAQSVRNNSHGKWFYGISQNHQLLSGWSEQDKEELMRRLSSSVSLGITNNSPFIDDSPSIVEMPRASLAQIYQWWERDGDFYRKKYLAQFYPRGETPNLTINNNGDYSRRDWMLLFSIGIFQRLGRVRDFGTRGFIEYLQQQGWWDTLCTNPKENGEDWLNMLYEYSESQNYDEEYSYWMTMLPNLFKISLKLDDYVRLFEGIQHRSQKNIPNVLTPNLDPLLQGSGFGHISPINRTLKKGLSLVVRELLRTKIISNPAAHSHAYLPAPRVQRILDKLSNSDFKDYKSSWAIYEFLCKTLGEEKATFGGDFDIPLLVLAMPENKKLLTKISGIELDDDESEDEFE
jgi:hypothetical protein